MERSEAKYNSQQKLSFGKARELAHMNIREFLHLLGSRGILMRSDAAESEEDWQTLKFLGRRKLFHRVIADEKE